jgi:hypothetical protein
LPPEAIATQKLELLMYELPSHLVVIPLIVSLNFQFEFVGLGGGLGGGLLGVQLVINKAVSIINENIFVFIIIYFYQR